MLQIMSTIYDIDVTQIPNQFEVFRELYELSDHAEEKQGRIHGYPSRVRVGRGCI